MAVAQVIRHVAYAICVYHEHCNKECSESATSVESRKPKALEWERQFEGIRKAINDVAEAIREGYWENCRMCSFGGISVCRTSEGRSWAALTVCSLQFPCQWWCKGEDIFRLGCWWAQWIFASDDVWPQGFLMDSYLWYVELLSAFLGCLVCIMVWENLDDSLRSKSSDSSPFYFFGLIADRKSVV